MIGFMAVFGALYFFSGAGNTQSTTETAEMPAATSTGVVARLINLEIVDGIAIERRFPGRIEAQDAVNASFEFEGRIEAVFVREGEAVRAGDPLAQLRTERLQLDRAGILSNLSSLTEQLGFAEQEEQRIARLVRSGAVAANQLERVRTQRFALTSELSSAQNALAQMDLRLSDATLLSPVDGVVGALMVSQEEVVQAGQPIFSLFTDGLPKFRVGLPANLDFAELQNVFLERQDQTYPVTLLSIRPDIDPRTNTRSAIFRVDANADFGLGTSALLTAQTPLLISGAWVPVDALRASPEGAWMVLAVGDNMVAQRLDVTVQHMRGDQAFVTGAFQNGTRIVGEGAHKVVAGQTLRGK